MNEETQLKLQAYLDGELSEGEAREVSLQLKEDARASALFNELQLTKSILRENEPELELPETREFYWSKIQREVERTPREAAPRPAVQWWKPAYSRFAGAFAAGCALLMISFIAFNAQHRSGAMEEVEGTTDEMGSITFQSDKDGMTVVYLFDREPVSMIDSE